MTSKSEMEKATLPGVVTIALTTYCAVHGISSQPDTFVLPLAPEDAERLRLQVNCVVSAREDFSRRESEDERLKGLLEGGKLFVEFKDERGLYVQSRQILLPNSRRAYDYLTDGLTAVLPRGTRLPPAKRVVEGRMLATVEGVMFNADTEAEHAALSSELLSLELIELVAERRPIPDQYLLPEEASLCASETD